MKFLQRKTHCLLLLLSLFLFFSCNKNPENLVEISGSNFSEEIDIKQNLSFSFNKDLASEIELNVWDSTDYIEFEPKINGKFKWVSENELIFSPSIGFSPATSYKYKVNKKILKINSNKKLYLGENISGNFKTADLKAENLEVYFTKNNEGVVLIKGDLKLNYPISNKDLSTLIEVKIGGKPYSVKINNDENSEIIDFELPAQDIGKEDLMVDLIIKPGLIIKNTNKKSEKNIEISAILKSRFTLIIDDLIAEPDGNNYTVRAICSQGIDEITLNNSIKISPEINFTTELTDNGFKIIADYRIGDLYEFTISKDIRGILGAELKDEYKKQLNMGVLPPSISFLQKKGIYLAKSGDKNIAVRITGIKQVNLKVYKLYENNILHYMRGKRWTDWDYYYDEEGNEEYSPTGYNYSSDEEGYYSDIIEDKKIEVASMQKLGNNLLLPLNFNDPNKSKGIFLVDISSDLNYWLRETKLISISDIGLIVKRGADHITILSNSLENAEPLNGVKISFIGKNNQVLFTGNTNSEGILQINDLAKKSNGNEIQLITASSKDDYNFILLNDTKVETSRFETEGKYNHQTGLDVFIYGQRNIYRPGETLFFNTIIRKENWQNPGSIPVKIKLVMPNGKELISQKANTDQQGAFETKIPLSNNIVTGIYNFEVCTGNGVLLKSSNISIEEFMPDRIKLNLEAKENINLKTPYQINIEAINLFGPPAADRNYEVDFQLSKKYFSPKKFKNYQFNISVDPKFNNQLRTGKTDAKGKAQETFAIDQGLINSGLLEAKSYVTVFDETGRPVNRISKSIIATQDILIGIKTPDYYVNSLNPVNVNLIALDPKENLKLSAAKVEWVKIDYFSVLQRDRYNNYSFQSQRKETIVKVENVTIPARESGLNISYKPKTSGYYQIKAYQGNSENPVIMDFYAYGWGSTENNSFDINTEGTVDIELDKSSYQVGENVKVLFKAPFNGKLIVSLERDKVVKTEIIKTENKSAVFNFKVTEDMLPNIYVSATLIRGNTDADIPITVAHGYLSVPTEKKDSRIPLEIKAAAKVNSNTKQKITIKSSGKNKTMNVTVAVVDEGILQLKNFNTPDPHGYFYAKMGLEVSSYDIYPFLFPDYKSKKSSTGGDGYDLEKRVNPLANKRVKLVAFWSGPMKTNSNGEISYEIDVPRAFSGNLRIMAVAYNNSSFGSQSANMIVADPLVLSPAIPRFLSPGDELDIPINISNTEAKSTLAKVSIKTEGPLEIIGVNKQEVQIEANREKFVYFKIRAKNKIGLSKIKFEVNGHNKNFLDEVDLSVRPASSLFKVAGNGMIEAGKSTSISLGKGIIAETEYSKLVVSNSPLTQLGNQLNYLLGYPHGCLEQTVSKAFPQIYFAELIKSMPKSNIILSKGDDELNPNFNIREAISKISSQQNYNGGFSYWGGYDIDNWWASVYATHFLFEAKKAGFEVSEQVFTRALEYLNSKSGSKELVEDYYYDQNTLVYRKVAPRELAYSLYVLSLAGKPNKPVLNYFKNNLDKLSPDARYLFAAALYLSGDKSGAFKIIPKDFKEDNSIINSGGSFATPIRNMSVMLNCLMEMDPSNAQTHLIARIISNSFAKRSWYSTQEAAFGLIALGKYSKKYINNNSVAIVSESGNNIGSFSNGKNLVLSGKKINGKSLDIKANNGNIFYFWESEGLTLNNIPEIDEGLRVRRTYYTRGGTPITNNKFKQNDLIVVKISLNAISENRIQNLVITDLIPAGFEIENPRLSGERELTWVKDQNWPTHFDIRDDRIHYYFDFYGNQINFYYLARAVNKGTFKQGPVSADAMYNGEFRSYNGAGSIIIE